MTSHLRGDSPPSRSRPNPDRKILWIHGWQNDTLVPGFGLNAARGPAAGAGIVVLTGDDAVHVSDNREDGLDMTLEAHNVHKFYGPRQALAGVSFAISQGECVGFLGVNGAGKSTVMRILTGFLAPTYGRVRVAGQDPRLAATRSRFGYLPESNPLPHSDRVDEYLRYRAGLKGIGRKEVRWAVQEVADLCNVTDVLPRIIGQLSKGMRQRVGLADSLLGRPDILVLDEPTAGLDPRQASETRDLIGRLAGDATVLLSSHILGDVERLCQRAIILGSGVVLADGSPDEICDANVEERTIILEIIANEPVREALRTVTGVRTISVSPDAATPEAVTVRVTTPNGVDLRRELSSICSERGWLITGMRLEPVTLEDIFKKLTAKNRIQPSKGRT